MSVDSRFFESLGVIGDSESGRSECEEAYHNLRVFAPPYLDVPFMVWDQFRGPAMFRDGFRVLSKAVARLRRTKPWLF